MLEQELHQFLTKSKDGDQIVFIVSGVLVTGKFVKYDQKLNVVHVETTNINGNSIPFNLTILDRTILAWGNPMDKTAGTFGR